MPYIIATTAPHYRLTSGCIISIGNETGGQDWPAITNEEREANARRIVQCVNAHDELLAICTAFKEAPKRVKTKNDDIEIHMKYSAYKNLKLVKIVDNALASASKTGAEKIG